MEWYSELYVHLGTHRSEPVAALAQRLGAEEFEDMAGPGHFGDALGKGLTLLAGEQQAQLALPPDQFGTDEVEGVGAQLDAGAGPSLACRRRGAYRLAGSLRVRLRICADDIGHVRRVDVDPDVGPGDPRAGDKICVHACAALIRVGQPCRRYDTSVISFSLYLQSKGSMLASIGAWCPVQL